MGVMGDLLCRRIGALHAVLSQ